MAEEKKLYEGHRERLRNRFFKDEGASMPEYELLELILTYGIPRKDTKPLAKNLIAKFGSLSKVLSASKEKLKEFGLTQNLITMLKVFVAASHQMHQTALRESDENVFANSDFMIDYCKDRIGFLDVEEFRVIFLDARLRLIDELLLQRGTKDSVSAYPVEVLKHALNYGASSVILYHNHPGGSLKASEADMLITKEIIKVLEPSNIKVNDHLIITSDNYFSFRDSGLLETIHKRILTDTLEKLGVHQSKS